MFVCVQNFFALFFVSISKLFKQFSVVAIKINYHKFSIYESYMIRIFSKNCLKLVSIIIFENLMILTAFLWGNCKISIFSIELMSGNVWWTFFVHGIVLKAFLTTSFYTKGDILLSCVQIWKVISHVIIFL